MCNPCNRKTRKASFTINLIINLMLVFIILLIFSFILINKEVLKKNTEKINLRTFSTSFESPDDFNSFYIVAQNHMGSSSHNLSYDVVHSGNFSHKAWIYASNPESSFIVNNNHRAYPTVQLYKTPVGSFKCPCNITFWVWLDMNLSDQPKEDDWFSFATFTSDETDDWSRTVLVNLDYEKHVHLMHVPSQGQKNRIFQTTNVTFPMGKWVKLDIYLDMDPENGYAKVWQDGMLVSYAKVKGGNGNLAQAHFGLYAPPQISSGAVYNDDLIIKEVESE